MEQTILKSTSKKGGATRASLKVVIMENHPSADRFKIAHKLKQLVAKGYIKPEKKNGTWNKQDSFTITEVGKARLKLLDSISKKSA